jgi:hypothetical protein
MSSVASLTFNESLSDSIELWAPPRSDLEVGSGNELGVKFESAELSISIIN